MLKFRMRKISDNSICTKIFQDDILSLQKNFSRFIRKEQGSMEKRHVYSYHVYQKIWQEVIGEELECD